MASERTNIKGSLSVLFDLHFEDLYLIEVIFRFKFCK